MIEGAIWRRWVFFRLPMAIFLIFLLFPFYWMIITTFRPDGELYIPWYRANYRPFWTWNPTTAHLKYLFGETTFAIWMWNTTFIAVVATAISLFCGVLAGYALSRLTFKGAALLGTTIFITYLVPQTLLFIPLSEIIRTYSLGDTPWSLILSYPTFLIPFCTWLMMGYFKSVPKELEECARIDGAARWQAMLYIIIPVAVPGILSAMIFAFTLSWNEFIYALVFLSSPEQKTVPVGVISELVRGDVFFWGPLMAGALFGAWLWNTMFIALLSTLISLICGVFAGYALSRLNFPFAGSLGTGIFITYLVPQTLLFIPLAEIIRNYRLGDTPWSLILTYPTFLIPFCTWLMMGYFKAVPKELEECARIDGASRWQAMLYIVIPVAIPGILSAGIFAFTLSWNEFIYALVFLSSPEQKTVPVGVTSELIRGDVFFWGPLMAGALLGSIPVAIAYSFFVEHYVAGLTGSVKG